MRVFSIAGMILLIAGMASGQTTRPMGDAPPQWERLVSSLTAATVARDPQAIQSLLTGDCRVGRFYAQPDEDSSQFLDSISQDTVLGDHAYLYPSAQMTADIARDMNSSTIASDFAKKTLNLNDKQSRTVAAQWMAQSLSVSDGDLVGIIILWDSRQDIDDQHRLIFVLVRGERDGDAYKFTRVVYGDPLQ